MKSLNKRVEFQLLMKRLICFLFWILVINMLITLQVFEKLPPLDFVCCVYFITSSSLSNKQLINVVLLFLQKNIIEMFALLIMLFCTL